MPVPWIPEDSPPSTFPRAECALDDPNGLVAAGGDLSVDRLLYAYQHGIFPWYADDQPILWWSPDPRCVFHVGQVHCSRSLQRAYRRMQPKITFDQAFSEVMHGCAAARFVDGKPLYQADGAWGTWITDDMLSAYNALHHAGHAHSVEVWLEGKLVGGLYGLAIGQAFFAESMFSKVSNASKIALVSLDKHLQHWQYQIIDAQLESDHLNRMGAFTLPRDEYLQHIRHATAAIEDTVSTKKATPRETTLRKANKGTSPIWQFHPDYWPL